MGNSRNLLVIDDDELHTQAFSERLERNGFKAIRMSKDFASVLDVIQQNNIELILLDLILPDTSGHEILKTIRTKYERFNLPVIILTGMNGSEDMKESFELGANDFVVKPFSLDMVVARIRAHLSHSDLDRALIQKKELEVLCAMVVTYCHEINNPLTIAFGEISKFENLYPEIFNESLIKLPVALERIREVVKKIQKAGDAPQVFFETYAGTSKMIKIK